MDKEVVKELIQNELNKENITLHLKELLNDPQKKIQIQTDYIHLKDLLSKGGNASHNAAEEIFRFLNPAKGI